MKTLANHRFGLVLLAAITVGVAGCGDSAGSSVAPTAATLSSSSSVLDSHGGGGNSGSGSNSGSGTNNGGTSNSGPGNNNSGPGKGDDGRNRVELHGSIQSVGGVCPVRQLMISGRAVSTSLSTEFHDVSCTSLAVGQMAEVKGTLGADGTIAADRIEVEERENDNLEGEVTGPVTASTGACPTLTLTVGTTTVKTTMDTVFRDVACTGVHVGAVIEAKGTRQADGSLLASTLEREENE